MRTGPGQDPETSVPAAATIREGRGTPSYRSSPTCCPAKSGCPPSFWQGQTTYPAIGTCPPSSWQGQSRPPRGSCWPTQRRHSGNSSRTDQPQFREPRRKRTRNPQPTGAGHWASLSPVNKTSPSSSYKSPTCRRPSPDVWRSKTGPIVSVGPFHAAEPFSCPTVSVRKCGGLDHKSKGDGSQAGLCPWHLSSEEAQEISVLCYLIRFFHQVNYFYPHQFGRDHNLFFLPRHAFVQHGIWMPLSCCIKPLLITM